MTVPSGATGVDASSGEAERAGTTTVVRTLGRPARISASRGRQSMAAAVVVVAVRGDQDDGLDLAEAVEDAERAEVG